MSDFVRKRVIAVLGTGAWGIALTTLLAKNCDHVKLWGVEHKEVEALRNSRCNPYCLPNIQIPENVEIYEDVGAALEGVRDILLAVPSHAFRQVLNSIKPYLQDNKLQPRLVWGTKGFDVSSTKLLHEVVAEIIGNVAMAVFSGPTFAREVARGLPTAITLAANDDEFAADLSAYLHSATFRVYLSTDLIGVQVGGAVKNVLAIAVGISDGLGFGANARCALITRGLAELTRLGVALGGKMETFMGLAGLGDLVLTCTDDQSRNRRFGLAIGQGMSCDEAEKSIGKVIEGIANARCVYLLAKDKNIEMPITKQVYDILYKNLPVRRAVELLLARAQKAESA